MSIVSPKSCLIIFTRASLGKQQARKQLPHNVIKFVCRRARGEGVAEGYSRGMGMFFFVALTLRDFRSRRDITYF